MRLLWTRVWTGMVVAALAGPPAFSSSENGASNGPSGSSPTGNPASPGAEKTSTEAPSAKRTTFVHKSASCTSGAFSCVVDASAIEDLQKAREKIEARAKELDEKEATLKVREQSVLEQLKKIEAIRAEVAQLRSALKETNEEKVQHLTETFLTMSPKAAARMLSSLDEKLAVEIAARMDSIKLAKVMNIMDPERASEISEKLVGVKRRRLASQMRRQEKGGSTRAEPSPPKGAAGRASGS